MKEIKHEGPDPISTLRRMDQSSAYVSMCYGKVKEERVSREPVVTQREGPHQTTIKTLWSWTLQLQNDKKVSLCCFIQLAVL